MPALSLLIVSFRSATATAPFRESSSVPLMDASAVAPTPPSPDTMASSTVTTKLLPLPSLRALCGAPMSSPSQFPSTLNDAVKSPQPIQVRFAVVSTLVCDFALPERTLILSTSSPNLFSFRPEFARFLISLDTPAKFWTVISVSLVAIAIASLSESPVAPSMDALASAPVPMRGPTAGNICEKSGKSTLPLKFPKILSAITDASPAMILVFRKLNRLKTESTLPVCTVVRFTFAPASISF